MGCGSAVGIVTGYCMDDRGIGVRVKNCNFSTSARLALGTTQLPNWFRCFLPQGVKREGREADRSPPTSVHGAVLS
jgi:hypothetical protein